MLATCSTTTVTNSHLLPNPPPNYFPGPIHPDDDNPRFGPLPLADANGVAAKCCETISYLTTHRFEYIDALEHVICIEFPSDGTYDVSTRGLTYNLVVPLLPKFDFPQEVVRSGHYIFKNPSFLYNDEMTPVIGGIIRKWLSVIDQNHMVLQGNYKNDTTLYSFTIPSAPPVYDIRRYRTGFFIATTVGFFLPLVWRIRDVTTEIGSWPQGQPESGCQTMCLWVRRATEVCSQSLTNVAKTLTNLVGAAPGIRIGWYPALDLVLHQQLEQGCSPEAVTSLGEPQRGDQHPQ
ncbi:hypothetical protein MTO96_007829 [Rhipicephalus appendiculatus]